MNKKHNEKSKIKISTIVGIVISVILSIILILNITLIVKSYTNKDEVPSIGGFTPMVVLTESMKPNINSGDLVITTKEEPKNIKVGDIITFFDPAGDGTSTTTHRVVEIKTEDGILMFYTKGDANNANDRLPVEQDAIIGKYHSKIPYVGNITMFLSTSNGLIVCVVIPMLLLFFLDSFARRNYVEKKKSDKEALLEELERVKSQKKKTNKKD
jgi:signal peptidase